MVLLETPIGIESKEPEWFRRQRGVIERSQEVELFNFQDDPQQLENLTLEYPKKVKKLKLTLATIIADGTCH